jgi:hypothetical protein
LEERGREGGREEDLVLGVMRERGGKMEINLVFF